MTSSAWGVRPDSLPVFPVFFDTQNGRLIGAVRAAAGDPLYLQVGCNLTYVPEFCGGVMLSAINVQVRSYDRGWGAREHTEAFDTLPTLADLLGDGALDRVIAAYTALPTDLTEIVRRRTAGGDKIKAMWLCGLASLAARMVAHCGTARRNSITYWDTRDGATRDCMKWISKALSGGVSVPESYARFYIDQSVIGAAEMSAYGRETMGLTGRVGPYYGTRNVTGLYMRNRNSGNSVATSTLYVSGDRPRNGLEGVPPIVVERASPTGPLTYSFFGPKPNLFVPHSSRFYPM